MDIDFFKDIEDTVAQALREDLGDGDITAQLIDASKQAVADVITRDDAIICGIAWVNEVFRQVDPAVTIKWLVKDGEAVAPDQRLLQLAGPARSILTGERAALNFLQTLSGTATRTRHYVDKIQHTNARLLDTRKTLPGLRLAQKYAVKCGGAENHRIGLYDAFLIKENHIAACGSIEAAVSRARELFPDRRVEIEVENLTEFRQAVAAAPDWIMLDNFELDALARAVGSVNADIRLEASGGIESDDDLVAIAETGVHYISIGALTKHVTATDLSLRII